MREKINFFFLNLWADIKRPIDTIKNIFFLLKYPFMRSRNVFTGRAMPLCYSTWYEYIPFGWREAFGKQFLKDLKKAIKKDKCKLRWTDIKTKWGSLVLDAFCGKNAHEVLTKYEHLSIGYCEFCGKPARYATGGWITYLCEDCFNDVEGTHPNFVELKKKCRLKKEDIPKTIKFEKDKYCEVDYGIDFETLWDLKNN